MNGTVSNIADYQRQSEIDSKGTGSGHVSVVRQSFLSDEVAGGSSLRSPVGGLQSWFLSNVDGISNKHGDGTLLSPTSSGALTMPIDEEERAGSIRPLHKTGIEEIYPGVISEGAPILKAALRLLSLSVFRLRNSEIACDDQDPMEADDEVQHFQMLLPEMFCLRELSEGYATVVNAARIALDNRAGEPLERSQLVALRRTMEHVQAAPYLNMNVAMELLDELEEVGLEVDPPALSLLADTHDDGNS